jgi:hypothetical protein
MRVFALAALLLAALSGCANRPQLNSSLGNFIADPPADFGKKIANDAMKQILAAYPPARTRFDLQQTALDPFGTSLVTSLRAKGYALQELKPESGASGNARGQDNGALRRKLEGTGAERLPLGYVLDQANESNLYRVTLWVGKQALSRAYVVQNGSVFPAGSWVRKE